MSDRTRIAVLASGGGSNLQAIIDAATADDYPAEIVVVISDRPEAPALVRAQRAGIASTAVDWAGYDDRGVFTKAVCDTAEDHGARALVLAGFMRILAPVAIDRFPHRIVNIHPALLPAFPGAHAVREALDNGVKVTGVTIHFVDEEVDRGPIIYQEAVAVLPDDDEATLRNRIQAVEHRVYPRIVAALATGDLSVDGRIVTWGAP